MHSREDTINTWKQLAQDVLHGYEYDNNCKVLMKSLIKMQLTKLLFIYYYLSLAMLFNYKKKKKSRSKGI